MHHEPVTPQKVVQWNVPSHIFGRLNVPVATMSLNFPTLPAPKAVDHGPDHPF